MTLEQPHELTWGDLVITSSATPLTAWRCEALADSGYGNPVPLVQAIRSMLTDGSLEVVTGYDNRELTVKIRLVADDGESLAMAEAAFMAEVLAQNPSPLLWTPPVINSWTAAFDIVRVTLKRGYERDWSHAERFNQKRFYELTMVALPWARDLETTVIEALPVPPDPDDPVVYDVIDACDDETGWTSQKCHTDHWGTVTIDNGTDGPGTYVRVYATNQYVSGTGYLAAIRPGSVSLAGLPYLTVDVIASNNPNSPKNRALLRISVVASGVPYEATSIQVLPSGVTRYFFEGLPDSFTGLQIRSWWNAAGPLSTRRTNIYEIGRTDRIEVDGTAGFQIARTAFVGGSAPTQAALTFSGGTDPLVASTALVYTGSSPAVSMRSLLDVTGHTITTDAAMISGGFNDLSVAMVFLVPVAQLSDSTYSLLARCNFTGSVSINWAAKIVDSTGADIPGSEVVASGTRLATNPTADPWFIHDLAAIQLPVIALEGSTSHAVEVTISMSSGGSGVDVDECWLFDTDNGAVTVIQEPSDDFDLTAIEYRSPGLGAPRPAVFGTWDVYGDQDISRLVTSLGTHLFWPGPLHVFTATDGAKYAGCELEYYRRHHTHPGPDLNEEE